MPQQRHLIAKTVLDIDTGHLADVWELQEEISRLFQQRAVPEMERLFDWLVSEDQVVRLDRVEIDLGKLNPQAIDEFVPALLKALNQTLSDRLTHQQLTKATAEPIAQNRATADYDVLLYFLQYGRLPWWVTETNWQEWLTRWQTVMQRDTHWRSALLKLLSTNLSVRQRLVVQFPEPFRHQLLLQLQPTWIAWSTLLAQARQLMQTLHFSTNALRSLETQAWLLILEAMQFHAPNQPLPAATWLRHWLAAHLLQTWQRESGTQLESPPGSSGANAADRVSVEQAPLPNKYPTSEIIYQRWVAILEDIPVRDRALWRTALDQVFASLSPSKPQQTSDQAALPQAPDRPSQSNLPAPDSTTQDGDHLSAQALPNSAATDAPDTEAIASRPTPDLSPTQQLSSLDRAPDHGDTSGSVLSPEEETAGIYINQAGLVLLHPFLATYFRGVGLVEEETFCNELAQQTAIYLLHYLATRQTHVPEYELVLPKLLCGWSLNEAIAHDLDLPAPALTEAENLLQTVINYWDALKSTSPDGLREGFLQRQGKLTCTDSGTWKLQVERQSIDILLSRLPWGLSIVKLPWMNDLLMVDWT